MVKKGTALTPETAVQFTVAQMQELKIAVERGDTCNKYILTDTIR